MKRARFQPGTPSRQRGTARAVAAATAITAAIFIGLPFVERLGREPEPQPDAVPIDIVALPPPLDPPPREPDPEIEPEREPDRPELEPAEPRAATEPMEIDVPLGQWQPDGIVPGIAVDFDVRLDEVDEGLFALEDLDDPPRPLSQLRPVYPSVARTRRFEGWVTLLFTVQADGSVAEVAVVEAQPPDVFDSAAVRAVQRWRFSPGTRDGKSVAVRVRQTIRFELEE